MSYGFNISLGAALPGIFTAAASGGHILVVLVCCRELGPTTGFSLQPQSHLDPCVLMKRQKPRSLFYLWSPGCRLPAVCFYYQHLVLVLRCNCCCSNTQMSNYTGTSSDEQDEFAMSIRPSDCQTPHGKLFSYLILNTNCDATRRPVFKCVRMYFYVQCEGGEAAPSLP